MHWVPLSFEWKEEDINESWLRLSFRILYLRSLKTKVKCRSKSEVNHVKQMWKHNLVILSITSAKAWQSSLGHLFQVRDGSLTWPWWIFPLLDSSPENVEHRISSYITSSTTISNKYSEKGHSTKLVLYINQFTK